MPETRSIEAQARKLWTSFGHFSTAQFILATLGLGAFVTPYLDWFSSLPLIVRFAALILFALIVQFILSKVIAWYRKKDLPTVGENRVKPSAVWAVCILVFVLGMKGWWYKSPTIPNVQKQQSKGTIEATPTPDGKSLRANGEQAVKNSLPHRSSKKTSRPSTPQLESKKAVEVSPLGSAQPQSSVSQIAPPATTDGNAQLPPVPQGAAPVQSDHGIVNLAPNSGSQSVNDNRQYGVPKPPPNVIPIFSQPVAPEIRPDHFGPESQTFQIRQHSEKGDISNPGLSLIVSVDAPFSQPMFRVHCDRPCIASRITFINGFTGKSFFRSEGPNFWATHDPSTVVFGSGTLTLLTPDMRVNLVVRSQDKEPIKLATVEPTTVEDIMQ